LPKNMAGPGGGFPALTTMLTHPTFDTPFYQQAAIAINGSACRPW